MHIMHAQLDTKHCKVGRRQWAAGRVKEGVVYKLYFRKAFCQLSVVRCPLQKSTEQLELPSSQVFSTDYWLLDSLFFY